MRIALLVTSIAIPLLLLAACGDEAERTTVEVTLSEFEVVTDVDSVPEGEVTFNIENKGAEEHEFVIVQTDFAADDLPAEDDGSVDEGADGVDVVGEAEDIESGDDDSRVFTLDPGKYVLFCNLVEGEESHYQSGMFTAFEVTAAD